MRVQQATGIALCAQIPMLWAQSDYIPACPDGICPMLGRTFYLPSSNAGSMEGYPFALNTKLGTCASVRTAESSTRAMKTSNSMHELVEDQNSDFSLSGGFPTAALTVKASVDVRTSTSTELTTSFHAVDLDVTYVTHEVTLDRSTECFSSESDFDSTFLTAFQSLPDIDPAAVSESSSWAPYVNFLKNQGSHIMTEQSIGSRFQLWESSTSTENDILHTLQVKACANVEGTHGYAGWSVNACAAYNSSEKEKALETASVTKRIIQGGTTAARIAVLTRLSNTTLSEFIDSAPNGTHPVRFGYLPVWDQLISFYQQGCSENGAASAECKNVQRGYNLQAAYEGWLAVGCPKLTTSNGLVYQNMAIANPDATPITYQCEAAKTGCHSRSDCHNGGAIGTVCYCYGESCIDESGTIPGTSQKRDIVRGDQSGYFKSGVNGACYYLFAQPCLCNYEWAGGLGKRNLWVQDESLGSLAKSPAVLV